MSRYPIGDFVFGPEERKAVESVVDSNRISEGPKVREFEKKWSGYAKTKYAVVTNSGTSALICAFTALKYYANLKERKRVIAPALTYAATINSVVTTNFEPVFIDVSMDTFSIDPQKVREYLETGDAGKCSVLLPVHLMGYPCDMDAINKICRKHDLICLEDCAEAHGSLYRGRHVGSFGLLSIFSFYISHSIAAGEMGSVNTSDSRLNQLLRMVKNHGTDKGKHPLHPFHHSLVGFNFKTTEFSAAIALTQLEKAGTNLKKRQDNVAYLNEGLEPFSRILNLPELSRDVGYLAYPLVIRAGISRERLRNELEKRGIETRPLFGCIPTQQPSFAHLRRQYEGRLPNAEFLGRNAFYIGCHQYLTQEKLDYAIRAFRDILKRV